MTTKANLLALLKKAQSNPSKPKRTRKPKQPRIEVARDLTPPQHWDATKHRTTSTRLNENVTLSVYEKPFDPYQGERHLAEYRTKFLTQLLEA